MNEEEFHRIGESIAETISIELIKTPFLISFFMAIFDEKKGHYELKYSENFKVKNHNLQSVDLTGEACDKLNIPKKELEKRFGFLPLFYKPFDKYEECLSKTVLFTRGNEEIESNSLRMCNITNFNEISLRTFLMSLKLLKKI